MSNKNLLIQNVDDLAVEEHKLWSAFTRAEKESTIGVVNLKKLSSISLMIKDSKNFIAIFHVPMLIFAVGSALLAIFGVGVWKLTGWITYIPFITLAIVSRDRLIQEYNKYELKQSSPSLKLHAFGIDYVSLKIYKFFDLKSKESGKVLEKDKLDKIIKIVKATQDYQSVTFGYVDHLRKVIYGAFFALPIYVSSLIENYPTKISPYVEKFVALVKADRVFDSLLLMIIVGLVIVLYQVLYGEKADTKRKKRYFIFLNLLKEGYVVKG